MGPLADIYVFQKSRSKQLVLDFLNHFIPFREESAVAYVVPQYAEDPIKEFKHAEDLMTFLEKHTHFGQSIYWRNTDANSLNLHAMVFYTEEGNMIFGISRTAEKAEEIEDTNQFECLDEMKAFFNTDVGYIDYENPPEEPYFEFKRRVDMFSSI